METRLHGENACRILFKMLLKEIDSKLSEKEAMCEMDIEFVINC